MTEITYQGYNKQSFAVFGDRSKYGNLIKSVGGRWNARLKNFPPGWIVPRYREAELVKIIDSVNTEKTSTPAQPEPEKPKRKYHRAISADEDGSEDILDQIISKKINLAELPQSRSSEQKKSFEEELLTQQKEQAKKQFEEDKKRYQEKLENKERSENVERSERVVERSERVSKLPERVVEHRERSERVPERRHRQRSSPPTTSSSSVSSRSRDLKQYQHLSKNPSKFRALYQPSDDEEFSESSSSEDSSSDETDSSSEDFPHPESPMKVNRRYDQEDYGQLYSKMHDLQKKLYALESKKKQASHQPEKKKESKHKHRERSKHKHHKDRKEKEKREHGKHRERSKHKERKH